jgi:hydrogenase maturation protease
MPETAMAGDPARPVLVFTWGNPSRGDDALGPALCDLIQEKQHESGDFGDVDVLTDFQLQVEHAVDLRHRRWVMFADASVSVAPPYSLRPLQPQRDSTWTTHAMSPAAVLAVYREVYGEPPPPAFMLSIRGHEFGLGQPLSVGARRYLDQAFAFVRGLPFGGPFDRQRFIRQFCT